MADVNSRTYSFPDTDVFRIYLDLKIKDKSLLRTLSQEKLLDKLTEVFSNTTKTEREIYLGVSGVCGSFEAPAFLFMAAYLEGVVKQCTKRDKPVPILHTPIINIYR